MGKCCDNFHCTYYPVFLDFDPTDNSRPDSHCSGSHQTRDLEKGRHVKAHVMLHICKNRFSGKIVDLPNKNNCTRKQDQPSQRDKT